MHINDTRLAHLLIFDGDQYKTDSVFIREFKRFHKKVIAKSIPESELSVLAPTKFFYNSDDIKEMEAGLQAFVSEELLKPEYEGRTYEQLHDSKEDTRKKLAQKLRAIIREKHSYRVGHGFVRPRIGDLLVWLRSCKMHAEHNFIKMLIGNTVILCIRWDADEGHVLKKCIDNSRCSLLFEEMSEKFVLRRVTKRIRETVHDNGRETRMGMFTWRLKSQDPTTYLNIFQNIWKSAF